jgi:MarR family transcriptional regulator, organic hydroperoxide resistance regulator
MVYKELAHELLRNMTRTAKMPFQKKVEDISHGERKILGFLSYAKSSATSGELSEALYLSTPRVASALNSLSKKGFIERSRDANDKRIVIVTITEAGIHYMEEERNEALTMIEQTLEKLGEHDAKEFVRIMKRITDITIENE